MKSFKRAVYKVGEIEEVNQVPCNQTLQVRGGMGIYEVDIILGTAKGTAGLRYESFSIPDRFQLFYDGNLVADSKYVGDLPYYVPFLEDVVNQVLPIYTYNGTTFVDSGTTETVTVLNSDIANGSPSEPLAGNGKILFNKNKDTVQTMTLRVFGVLGSTIWNATPICPYDSTTLPPTSTARLFDLTYQQFSNGDCLNADNGITGSYYADSLQIGNILYTDLQLLNKAKGGEYWLGNTIHIVDSSGKIVDIYPCSGATII